MAVPVEKSEAPVEAQNCRSERFRRRGFGSLFLKMSFFTSCFMVGVVKYLKVLFNVL